MSSLPTHSLRGLGYKSHFKPYDLTPLDHIVPTVRIPATLFFSLIGKDRRQVLLRLEDGISRLVEPASALEREKHPIFVTQYQSPFSSLVVNGRLNKAFLPLEDLISPSEPSPVLRIKANFFGDDLILIMSFDHRAMDGYGFGILMKSLALFSRNQNAAADAFVTSSEAQELARRHLKNIAESAEPEYLRWRFLSQTAVIPDLGKETGRVRTTGTYILSLSKIKAVEDACHSMLRTLPEPFREEFSSISISRSLIVSALVGTCCNRARLQAFGLNKQQSSPLNVAADVRGQSNLPPSYMGNSVVVAETSDEVISLPHVAFIQLTTPSPLDKDDLWQVCNLALSLRQEIKYLTERPVHGMIATLAGSRDGDALKPVVGSKILVSDVHQAPFYENFGPLGDVQWFDIPLDTIPGLCWIMPNPPSMNAGVQETWRLRLILEQAATEYLRNDTVFRWLLEPTQLARQGTSSKL